MDSKLKTFQWLLCWNVLSISEIFGHYNATGNETHIRVVKNAKKICSVARFLWRFSDESGHPFDTPIDSR